MGPVSPCTAWSVRFHDMPVDMPWDVHKKSAVFLICFLFRLTKLRISDPMSTVELSKQFHTTAIAASRWSLSERGYSGAGTPSMNSPTGVQLWVRRLTMQLNWWDFCRSGWIQNQLCKWTSLSWRLAPDVLYWYHPWSWRGKGNVYDAYHAHLIWQLLTWNCYSTLYLMCPTP